MPPLLGKRWMSLPSNLFDRSDPKLNKRILRVINRNSNRKNLNFPKMDIDFAHRHGSAVSTLRNLEDHRPIRDRQRVIDRIGLVALI
jgi:hypothetical protein